MDLYAVQYAVPARKPKTQTNQQKQPSKQKTQQKQTKETNQNNQKNPRSGIATSNGNNVHNDILCVMMRMATEKQANQSKTQNTTEGPCKRVKEATKLNAETRDPPSQDPRDHREQPFRHNVHPNTSKQTPTTPGRSESGEKTG